MAQTSKLNHHVFSNVALPYVSNSSALSVDPQFIQGSSDILTNIRGIAEKRAGFATGLESVVTAFTNLQRIYFFEKWNGQFYVLFCSISGGRSKVYKYAVGVDYSAVLIYTSVTSTAVFDFCTANDAVYFGNGVDVNKKFLAQSPYDTTVYNMGIASQPAAPNVSLVAGTLNGSVGYQYRTTGYNSTTGGESSPSNASACTGVFTAQAIQVTWVDPVDTQCDFVKVYRTTDGGSNDSIEMHLVGTVARGVQTLTDNTVDTAFTTQTAPALNYNDPMPPVSGMVWAQGRIWGFSNASTWYSGYEEITNGVKEETCPGGTLGLFGGGNVYNWPRKVGAHAPMTDGVAVFLASTIWKIEGDSLDTFRRYILVQKRGAKYQPCVTALGSSVMWFDTAGQVWLSDLGEIGTPIRPDTKNMDQSQVSVAIHISGDAHWCCLLDGANGKLYIFDLDNKQWLPPWSIGISGAALSSGEISDGTTVLALARNKSKALYQTAGVYTDDKDFYAGNIKTGMMWIAEASAFLERYDRSNPEWRGVVDNIEVKTDLVVPDSVSQLNDDDPALGTYTILTATSSDNLDVPQGAFIKTTRYPSQPTTNVGRMASFLMNWQASSGFFRLYQFDIGYQIRGQ